mgnify:CR=1 FL=1
MLTLEMLREYGANTEEGLKRCMNNEAFYLRMVGMIAKDQHADALETAVEQGDLQAAFEAAHALKGTLANLALTPALNAVTEILEPLRRREARTDYPECARKVKEEMKKLQEMIGG